MNSNSYFGGIYNGILSLSLHVKPYDDTEAADGTAEALQSDPWTAKVLDYLKDHDGANQKEIAAACHIEAGSLTSVLNRMEDQNMVERRILNGNRRSFHVFLTKNGRRLQQIVEQKFHEIEAVALSGISEEDLNFFLKTFQKVQDNLSSQNSSNK